MSTSLVTSPQHRNLKKGSQKRIPQVQWLMFFRCQGSSRLHTLDPPIKRFAERHKYAGTDTIAVRDLGFVFSRQGSGSSQGNGSSSTLARTDTLQSFSSQPANQSSQAIATSKRAPSPDQRRRDDGRSSDFGPPSKRPRPASPRRDRERERERWDGPRRHLETPSWEKERERDAPPARRFNKDEDKGVTLPPVLSWFAGVLPTASSFDGELVPFFFSCSQSIDPKYQDLYSARMT